jgi:stage V sporulation protein AD
MEKNRKIIDTSGALILAASSVVGGKEFEGPLGSFFDFHDPTDRFGQKTFERSEGEMQRLVLANAMSKLGVSFEDIDALFAGDLMNQCVSSAYGLLEYDIPYFGLYGACSTAAEGLMLASILVSRGISDLAAAVTSSHNSSAERQYRNPIEYGGQRTPTAQWTVTGAGAFVVGREGDAWAEIADVFPGVVVEKGVTDSANMGAAMAPAAADTLLNYFEASGTSSSDYDVIISGDLGKEGLSILGELLSVSGVDASGKLDDCGLMIYDLEAQDVHAGGSGCGCSASVLAASILPRLKRGDLRNILFYGTGAMMSPSSLKQGLAIPAVAHLLHLKTYGGAK